VPLSKSVYLLKALYVTKGNNIVDFVLHILKFPHFTCEIFWYWISYSRYYCIVWILCFPVCFCVLLFLIAPFMSSFCIFLGADVSALGPFCPAHCYFTHCHFALLLMT